jgi:tRNA A37 threonylcarbamoyladenosine synthetase subunit TsaC/SUA5/YrdC
MCGPSHTLLLVVWARVPESRNPCASRLVDALGALLAATSANNPARSSSLSSDGLH